MDNSVYREIRITGEKRALPLMEACAGMLSDSLLIRDDSDFTDTPLSADELLSFPVSVSLYLPEGEDIEEPLAFLKEKLNAAGVPASVSVKESRSRDYADNWKAYYKPQYFDRYTIVPAWESYDEKPGEAVIYMDPGQVFGAGTHETTRLCLSLMEKALKKEARLLDIGTGSGILSIVAWKLAKVRITATDLDPDAVANALENMARNGITNAKAYASDLLSDVPTAEYDIVVSNMVSGLLLRLLPALPPYLKAGGKLVLSGIIDQSRKEVLDAAHRYGFHLLDSAHTADWNALLLEKL